METFTKKQHWITLEEIKNITGIEGSIQEVEYDSADEELYIVTHISGKKELQNNVQQADNNRT